MDRKYYDLHIMLYNGNEIIKRMIELDELFIVIQVLLNIYNKNDNNFIKHIRID